METLLIFFLFLLAKIFFLTKAEVYSEVIYGVPQAKMWEEELLHLILMWIIIPVGQEKNQQRFH